MTYKSSFCLSAIFAPLTVLACGPEGPAGAPSAQTSTAAADDQADAGSVSGDAASEDSGPPSLADTDEKSDESEFGVGDGSVQVSDAAPDDTPITESIVTEKGVCNGTPVCDAQACECDAVGGDGGCAYIHCEQHHTQSQCADAEGCDWEIVTDVNEGTATGKRCTGDVGTCEEQNWECKTGCEETFNGNRRVCSGTPEPCSAKVYEADCGRILKCTWQ